jgi:hypothetical protein
VTALAAKETGPIVASALAAADFIKREELRGYDPYDGLESPLFGKRPLSQMRLARLAAQQMIRRLPLNARPLLGIGKGYNPVTVAFVLQGCVYLKELGLEDEVSLEDLDYYICELSRLRSNGFSGNCWGYDFDWEGRYVHIPADVPNVVATGIVTNALYQAYVMNENDDSGTLCEGAAQFVMTELNRSRGPGGFCWSYSPNDSTKVLNASMLAARLCAQAYAITGHDRFIDAAREAAGFVIANQLPTGAWPYAVGDKRAWSDNFHTGYVLDCLADCRDLLGESAFTASIERGWRYYRERFVLADGTPKYYDEQTYPIDASAAAQAITTLARFGDLSMAMTTARRTIGLMQNSDGSFKYRIYRSHTNGQKYMRWSIAPMFAALTMVAYEAEQASELSALASSAAQ